MSAEPDSDAKHKLLGHTVFGYRLTRLLGQGGMGAVFEAEPDPNEGSEKQSPRVAVKVLHERLAATDPTAYQRFMQEARTTSRVDHPTLVKVLDFGQLQDGWAFIIMELLTGELLRERMRRFSPLPVSDVQHIGTQLASGLGASHAKGIIHRDMKPENVMLVVASGENEGGKRERVKILDFGIAKIAAATGSETLPGYKTATGAILGSPAYMSPEQCRGAGAQITDRSDVYSLGVMFYEMLAGVLPFQSKSSGELIVMHLMDVPTPLLERAPAIPGELAQLVDRMLSKKTADRPSMREVAETLLLLGEGSPTVAGGRQALATRRIGVAGTVLPALRRRQLWRVFKIAGGLLILGVLVVLAVLFQVKRIPLTKVTTSTSSPAKVVAKQAAAPPQPVSPPPVQPAQLIQPQTSLDAAPARIPANKNRKLSTKKSLGGASRSKNQPESESNELQVKPTL